VSTSKVIPLRGKKADVPNTENGKVVPPSRKNQRNKDVRPREYLTEDEVDQLMTAAATCGRHGHRDRTLILIAFRHALRASELISLRWDAVDLKQGLLHVSRLKNGIDSVHPLRGPELRALRRVRKAYPDSPYVFVSERGGPMTSSGVRKMIKRAGDIAEIGFSIHPHMLRHSTGYKLANDGQDTRAIQQYMGHKNIQHTVRYTELSHDRFKSFWRD
jgi:type 1 fimbriae regulatory protein FimE